MIYTGVMKTRILVIEDEEDIRDLISLGLRNSHYEIVCVESADLAKIELSKKSFDLFIVDWMLPGNLSGIDFCRHLRSLPIYKETPIIMVTALTQPENIVLGLDA